MLFSTDEGKPLHQGRIDDAPEGHCQLRAELFLQSGWDVARPCGFRYRYAVELAVDLMFAYGDRGWPGG